MLDEEEIKTLASDFALGEAMHATCNDRQVIPYLPLLIGTRRYQGNVNKKRWWAWEVSFTWIREH
jgi:hypothetical protein